MSLRSKVLTVLLALTLIPLIGVGVVACVHAFRWSHEVVDARLARSAERAAADISGKYAELTFTLNDLGASLMSAGERAGRLDARGVSAAVAEWGGAAQFASVELRDDAGRVIAKRDITPVVARCATGNEPTTVAVTSRIRNATGTAHLVGRVSVSSVFPAPPANDGEGHLLVIDRATGGIVHDPSCEGAWVEIGLDALPAERRGHVSVRTAGGMQRGWYVNLAQPDWLIVSAPNAAWPVAFSDERLLPLLLVMVLALVSGGAFVILLAHLRDSLDELTRAAVRIGQGDFVPWLPPPGEDEVGRLSFAIGTMAARLHDVMHQNVRTRQMAALGELASHVSHEIRNPLSSIKLNLQSVEREVRTGDVPGDLPSVLQLCLREINRLDGTVQGVLRLAGFRQPVMEMCAVHGLLEDTLRTVAPQLKERAIEVRFHDLAPQDRIRGDAVQLRSVFLNLFLNAADSMQGGGALRIWTEAAEDGARRSVIRVRVADSGEGVPPELRDRIFQPFFSTKQNGSGIGLPLALQTIEAHNGRLWLETRSELDRGAEFVVELPLVVEVGTAELQTALPASAENDPALAPAAFDSVRRTTPVAGVR
jgi:signal transduction histidine kinase